MTNLEIPAVLRQEIVDFLMSLPGVGNMRHFGQKIVTSQ